MTTLNFGNANQTIAAGSNETIIVGDGNDNIAIGSNDNLTVGNGNDTVTVGANSTVTAGNGGDTVTAGAGSTVTVGSGHDTVTVGANSTVTAGNGGDTVTAGAGSTVTVGNGGDTVIVGSNSSVTTGDGSDTVVFAGSNDTATIGKGDDTVVFQPSATPILAAPATLSVNEDGTIALPISTGLSAASFGHDTIYGFAAASDHLEFTTAQFANFATLMADAKQVGQDTVITSDPADTITLKGVALSSLVAKDFVFVNGSGGSGGNLSVTISGLPSDASLSDSSGPLTVTNGSITLTPVQLAGLTLQAGESSAMLTVTATNTTTGDSVSQTIALTVNPVAEAPSLAGTATSITVNEGATIALPIAMTPKDGDDTVAITVTGVPTDTILSAGTNNGGGNWSLTAAQLAGLQITAGEDTTATLTVTATNSEGLGAATSQTISLTVSPVPEVPSLSAPSSLTTTVNGSVALPIGVTPQDADDVLSVTISGIPSDATLSDNSGPLTVTSGSVTLTPAQLAGLTLHAGATPATLTVTATNSESTSASARQDVFLTLSSGSANLWAASKIPAQTIPGDHIYAPALQINASLNFEGILYGETTANYSVPGPDVVTDKLLTLDPFLLAENGGSQALETSTIYKFPFRYNFILPNVTSTQAEGIAVYETQDQSGNRFLNQVFVTRNGASAPLTVGTPTQIETLTAPEENPIFVSFRNNSSGTLASYDVAWDQFNGSAQTYTINFQIFNPNGSTSSPVETPVSLTGVTGGVTALPGWFFRSGFGAYALAYAKPSTTVIGQQVVQFQGYNTDGTPNATSFAINPDLSHYAAGATNQITLEQNPRTHTLVTSPLKFAQFFNNEAAIAWNETVTDTNGTHDQVEFVIFKPGQGVVSRTTFQISDGLPQEINLQIQKDVAVLEYGDNTATNIVEFDSNGLQLGAATESTTQTAQSLIDFGDGRVGIVYDYLVDSSGTSQLVTHVYDFRTIGVNINDSTLVDGLDKYVAGTKFNDTFVGENNVNNTYDFIGQNTGGPAPSDSFTGGSNGWNVAILPDAESNYSITTANGTTTLTNTGDPPHAGTLAVTNVQALAFNPAADPSGNPGTLQATGDRLDILGPLPGGGEPITIGTGSTLELNTPDNGPVTFAGPTGTLQLHVSSSLTGQISGFGAQDGIDLADVSFGASTTLGYTPNNSNTGGVLAVSDGTHTANLALLGNYMASSFVIASDGHGGTLLTDPPPTSLQQPFLTQP